ncbi:Adenosylmethionine-8-amino-7-oxononanoate aminotransferase [Saccharopolyspora antimicrobica]|uniref:Adenosylmethionine-8-amino-7-oxononanoate aminotransferase n=1 Tax=Saccharopolyspora antimicrobica TaxID=455193 RepID=A0A1I5ACN8_9PSEU|nr:aspartate aminotransferase family protein [Saccharopolyspora antimicrobica]RKT83188.1 adenosylmethionine-8-amino-7-oxononanoate aminotransferase [Saccharopolyspora antimicrobica]SFN60197.1 Adenosylmethionine-8-amino-7-oxononanoate aminotransferase [Saccharopolyspora antimicrobica]
MSVETNTTEELAKRHLVMNFTPASKYRDEGLPIFVRGEGCYVHDESGKRYFDGLAGLFCTQLGYSHGAEVGEAVARQMSELPFQTTWSVAHPPAAKLAAELAAIAPGELNRVFFTSSGSESNEAAIKLARQYHISRGEHARRKFVARRVAYHGTSFGAMSLNGMVQVRKMFEPLMSGVRHVSNTKRYQRPEIETEAEFTAFLLAEIEALVQQEGPDTIAAIILEPLQNAGGSLTPPAGYFQGVRELCDRHGILLIADEVITGFGRLGEWFGCIRYGFQPDIITFAKGIASAYVPLGGLIADDRIIETVLDGPAGMYNHALTYGGHPVACAAALTNLEIMRRLDVLGNVRATSATFAAELERLREIPIVGDIRGDGYHRSLELVTDRAAKSWASERLPAGEFVNDHLAPAAAEVGVLCRLAVDSEGNPLLQLSPPLVADADAIRELVGLVEQALTRAVASGGLR